MFSPKLFVNSQVMVLDPASPWAWASKTFSPVKLKRSNSRGENCPKVTWNPIGWLSREIFGAATTDNPVPCSATAEGVGVSP